jgi:hypothetical protein
MRRGALPLQIGVVATLLGHAAALPAQTVVEVQGGGSSLLGGYGATANFWRSGVDGWIGLGYLRGLRAGAFLRTGWGKDTVSFGNDALVVRFPTDVFSSGTNLLVQGASYGGGSDRTSYLVFGGASSAGIGAPSFQPTSIEAPLGAVFVQHRISPRVRLSSTALVARRQTLVPGLQWQISPTATGALVAGIGSDRPYAASSIALQQGDWGLKASYAWNPDRFRRAAVPTPNQTEADRENVQLTYDISSDFQIGLARQNFVQDSADAKPAIRASGNSLFAGGRWRDTRLTAGLYYSSSEGIGNLSSYLGAGREVTRWLDTEVFLLQSHPEGRPASVTPVANLRWRISPRVGLMQQVSFHDERPTVLLGASLRTAIGEFGADYQIVHQPFQPFNPFRSTLNLTARLQLGSYSTSIGTYIQADGSVDYAASGSTFLYMGAFGGIQPNRVGAVAMGRYVVRGSVTDESGAPIEGAALEVGGEIAFTDSRGAFFLRVRRPKAHELRVLPEEFLLPGNWEVVSAPAEAMAEPEERAQGVRIVLRRM